MPAGPRGRFWPGLGPHFSADPFLAIATQNSLQFSLPQASAGVLVSVGRVGAAGAHADAAKATQVHGSSR